MCGHQFGEFACGYSILLRFGIARILLTSALRIFVKRKKAGSQRENIVTDTRFIDSKDIFTRRAAVTKTSSFKEPHDHFIVSD